ncbi:DUF4085 family protein [Fredinandcohnia sp. 179-A 10B2 NHS]|uniref:DUF4085 family protein n=1 Tax=Fredinandcohnia sp. 179-A 10B2 NHS TaxID=3235176 RepID=UPI0039A1B01A
MRFFTIDWYNEMQVNGFMAFPETREEWDEMIQYYEEEGIDYKENARLDLESRKSDLLKYLPESLHPYIHDGTINSEYPTLELREKVNQWLREYDERMERIYQEYNNHFKSIKNKLPKNVVQLHEKSLHDASIKSIKYDSTDTLSMILDCSGGFHYFTDIQLTFTGVKKVTMSRNLEGAFWLYDEVYVCENKQFELGVLFDNPLSEFSIIAEDVMIKQLK